MKWTEPDRHPIDGAPSARAPCRAPRSGGREGPPEYTTRHAALYSLVPKGGLEPPRVAPHAPQTCASANSATSARRGVSMPRAHRDCQSGREDSLRPSTTESDDPSHSRLSEPRVQRVADPLAHQVVGEHRDQDGQPRVERHPPRDLEDILAVVEDISPGGIGRLNAEPEKGKTG